MSIFQIQQHTAGCLLCGKRTARLLLSTQQRRAISRRHHLKFILGHYGSGKVHCSFIKVISWTIKNLSHLKMEKL